MFNSRIWIFRESAANVRYSMEKRNTKTGDDQGGLRGASCIEKVMKNEWVNMGGHHRNRSNDGYDKTVLRERGLVRERSAHTSAC